MKYFHFLITIIISIRLFSFAAIGERFWDYIEISLLFFLILVVITKTIPSNKNKSLYSYRYIVVCFIVIYLFSFIPSYLFHDQSVFYSLLVTRFAFYWLLYEVLIYYNLSSKLIINTITIFGVLWALIHLVQQYTYPDLFFYIKEMDSTRAGVNRINFLDVRLCIISGIYLWVLLLKNFKLLYLIAFILISSSLALTVVRQIIFPYAFILFITFFYLEGQKHKFKFISITAIVMAVLTVKFGTLFNELIEYTTEQNILSGDYIRILSAGFFGIEYFPNWVAYIIGNGVEHFSSEYGKEIERYKQIYGFYRSDIGLIGAFNKYGIFYIILSLYTYFKIIFENGNSNNIITVKLFIIYLLITAFTGQNYFEHEPTIILLCCCMYIIDQTKKEREFLLLN